MKTTAREQFERELAALVARFDKNRDDYRRADYPEAEVRSNFIDPFFEALGWDMRDQRALGRAREVTREISEKSGRPDYAFRVDARKVFYVEAKAPHVALERTDVILQVKRYAWSASVDLGLVTDFEEIRIYDTRVKPSRTEPNKGLIRAFRYSEYLAPETLDVLWLLSREAVASGSLAQLLAMSRVPPRQRKPVDLAFLDDLTEWRAQLAKYVFKVHPTEAAELNSIVQVFLDRLIFIRVAEDRAILSDDLTQLQSIARRWETRDQPVALSAELRDLFAKVNARFNGDFFNQHACEEIDWELGAELVVSIINGLYEPYRFDVIPVELLGSIYERYLGKTIRVTDKRAVVEDKPEVRKAGGVYYTPKYIVDYIVAQTVGKLIEGKTPEQIKKIKILDPACGSGSFLIGAYQALLDYHTRYLAERAQRRGGGGDGGQALLLRERAAEYGEAKLSLLQKAEIMQNNLFGVDIDAQAVQITKMSLYIKMLEGERGAIVGQGVLPRLRENVKCGNSLIAHDIGALPEKASERIKPFTWESKREGFGEIMAAGGFDAVIGNPPYGAEFPEATLDYLKSRLTSFVWRGESYSVFLEQATRLLKIGGCLGYIIPDTYLNLGFTQTLRAFLLQNTHIREVVTLPSNIFAGATVDTTLLFVDKAPPTKTFHESTVTIKTFDKRQPVEAIADPQREFSISTSVWHQQDAFNVSSDIDEMNLLAKIEGGNPKVADVAKLFYGIKVYQVGKGVPPQTKQIRDTKPFTSEKQKNKSFLPFFDGMHIGRYESLWNRDNWINYGPWLAEPRKPEKYQGEKILIRKIVGSTLIATYIPETSYCNTLLFVLKIESGAAITYPFLLGVLNSRCIGWYFRRRFQISAADTFPQIMIRDILQFPIPPADQSRHDQLVARVERMLELHQQKQAAKSDAARERLQREINVTDEQIDALVYELYGLTKEEIAIVEKDTETR